MYKVFYKSRTNASLKEIELIFDKEKGFSKLLSMLHYANENKLLTGSATKMTIPIAGVDTITFSRKTFLAVARQNPALVPALYELVEPHMRSLVSTGHEYNVNETDEQRLAAFTDIMNKLVS